MTTAHDTAAITGFPPERTVLHGNAKSPQELEIARPAAAVGTDGHQKPLT